MTVETKAEARKRKIKAIIKTVLIGATLAFACRALPAEYQGPCETVVKICSGGLGL